MKTHFEKIAMEECYDTNVRKPKEKLQKLEENDKHVIY